MKHLYTVKDSLEIKLIVLYTLQTSSKPLSGSQLTQIILSSAKIDFFEVHQALDFLIMANEVFTYKNMDDIVVFQLTDDGKNTVSHFYMHIPLEIQEYIKHELDSLFIMQRKERQLTAIPVPINHNEFVAQCRLCDNDLPLLEMSFYAGSLNDAKKMCENFKSNTTNIYETLLNMLTEKQ